MTETTGSIINIVNTGQVITLTVKYMVDHHVYSFKEEAVLKPARQLLLFKSKKKSTCVRYFKSRTGSQCLL